MAEGHEGIHYKKSYACCTCTRHMYNRVWSCDRVCSDELAPGLADIMRVPVAWK
jgi:hypothetical protein